MLARAAQAGGHWRRLYIQLLTPAVDRLDRFLGDVGKTAFSPPSSDLAADIAAGGVSEASGGAPQEPVGPVYMGLARRDGTASIERQPSPAIAPKSAMQRSSSSSTCSWKRAGEAIRSATIRRNS